MMIDKYNLKADLLSEISLHNGGDELAEGIVEILDAYITPLGCCCSDNAGVLRVASMMLKKMPFYSAKCVLDNLDKMADRLENTNG